MAQHSLDRRIDLSRDPNMSLIDQTYVLSQIPQNDAGGGGGAGGLLMMFVWLAIMVGIIVGI